MPKHLRTFFGYVSLKESMSYPFTGADTKSSDVLVRGYGKPSCNEGYRQFHLILTGR